MARTDPHSYFDDSQPRTRHLGLELEVDFEEHRLEGWAMLDLGEPSEGPLDLDTKDLEIYSVEGEGGEPIPFDRGEEEPILGKRLRIHLPEGTRRVTIEYVTSPEAIGLQWLDPAQTEGKRHPFVFTHFQPIHARTCMPCQDSPRARVVYRAAITVPSDLTAVMSAGSAGKGPGDRPGTTTYLFDMPHAIPTYLIALAVGNLDSRALSPRSRVWAEPETVEAAEHEFAGIEDMITRAEELFGPYEWDRYDMLVLPPSFPYGGMENPRLTFLTPTLLAGDRSLVDVVAHELAHSWTGNLVTNASVDHFWLNEGATVWAERRIVEALHGQDAAALGWAIGEKALQAEFKRFGADAAVTRLRNDLKGTDPDDVFSSIPYEKGARFMALLERTAGRERFDAFIRSYIERFRFTSITTEEFMNFVNQELPGAADQVGAQEWLYEPGMPKNAPVFRSPQLEALDNLADGFADGERPTAAQIESWSPAEMLVYLQRLPRPLDEEACRWLDKNLELTERGNYEILVEWLTIAAASDYEPVFERVREVLLRVGRMKYLRPLYKALGATPRTRALAREVYAAASPGYHELSRRVSEAVMDKYDA
ncbi:MAG: M1 family metallopeptidase [Acidobacteria bacterium]|nr:M1 family metallopeptidase [Acidobacteriota bacterium]